MRAPPPLHVEAGFWLLLCGALAAGLGIETDWGRELHRPVAVAATEADSFQQPGLAEPFRMPPADEYIEMALRPPFIVTRRPAPPPPPPEAPKPTMKQGQFLLKGITIVGPAKFAFVLEKAGSKNHVLTEGKEINGIRVKEIAADRVILSQYDETEILPLQTAKGPPATAAAVPAQRVQQQGVPPPPAVTVPATIPAINRPPVIGPPPILPSDVK